MSQLQTVRFSGALLLRGFWLYVWEIETVKKDRWLYVGRTGDRSSPNAQSPFTRLGQHLGSNKHANALRRHLAKIGVDPDTCRSFELSATGPILPEAATMDDHRPMRNKMAALEYALRNALHSAGYPVLNELHCLQQLDEALWKDVLEAFVVRFPKLKTVGTEARDELQTC